MIKEQFTLKRKKYLSRLYLLPTLILLAIVFTLLKFTFPQLGEIMEMRRQLKTEKERLGRLTEKAVKLEKKDRGEVKNDFLLTQNAIPSEKDIPGVLYAIERLGVEMGAAIDELKVSPGLVSTPSATSQVATPSGEPSKPSGESTKAAIKPKESPTQALAFLTFDLSLHGELTAIRDFLGKIKEINPILQIKEFKLSIDDKGLSADFKIIFSHQPLPISLGKLDDSLPVFTDKDEVVLEKIGKLPVYSQMPSEATTAALGKPNPFE